MDRLIVYLIRKKLGLKKFECFRFTNQKSNDAYFFGGDALFKITNCGNLPLTYHSLSGVSLNWLLDEDCEITKLDCPCSDMKCDSSFDNVIKRFTTRKCGW